MLTAAWVAEPDDATYRRQSRLAFPFAVTRPSAARYAAFYSLLEDREMTATTSDRRLLRSIVRTQRSLDWGFSARASDGWVVVFRDSKTGAEYRTEHVVRNNVTGGWTPPFDDAQPVFLPSPYSVSGYGSDARVVAKLLADGWRLRIEGSRGSVSSSEHGIGSLHLVAYEPGVGVEVRVGSESLYVGGRRVWFGTVGE
jgi:hypothetical protein